MLLEELGQLFQGHGWTKPFLSTYDFLLQCALVALWPLNHTEVSHHLQVQQARLQLVHLSPNGDLQEFFSDRCKLRLPRGQKELSCYLITRFLCHMQARMVMKTYNLPQHKLSTDSRQDSIAYRHRPS